MNTITRRQTAAGRRAVGALRILLAAAVRYGAISTPALTVTEQAASAPTPGTPAVEQHPADPAGLFADEELPPLADIEAAAESFLQASEQTRTADRARRAARKVLDRLPAGRHGKFEIEYVDNAREIADLEAIRAIFKAHDLGNVPMRRVTPSLKVTIATEPIEAARA